MFDAFPSSAKKLWHNRRSSASCFAPATDAPMERLPDPKNLIQKSTALFSLTSCRL
ncbi:hypothetical protein PSAB6_70447 [Paraburkholderia sabiae]|nr:hypothetical protein PSAB6_70447 [Paraburkholderia sabiae]